jgi:hypothetical protein
LLPDLLHDSATAASETQYPYVCQTHAEIICTGSAFGANDQILLVLTYLLELIMPELLVMQYQRTNMVPCFFLCNSFYHFVELAEHNA